MRFCYDAFGLEIQSDFAIAPLLPCETSNKDPVYIREGQVPKSITDPSVEEEGISFNADEMLLFIPEVATFYVNNGKEVIVQPEPEMKLPQLQLYLLGSCVGALLHQRGILPLHGSCLCKDKECILIIGESGAGKSTLASGLVARGWKLLTDDVAAIVFREGVPYVQSSYPSQKLWEDAFDYYEGNLEKDKIIYRAEGRDKYARPVGEAFIRGEAPLTCVVNLYVGSDNIVTEEVEGFAKVHRLMCNIYRPWLMVTNEKHADNFQRAVHISQRVPIILVGRPEEGNYEDLAERVLDKTLAINNKEED